MPNYVCFAQSLLYGFRVKERGVAIDISRFDSLMVRMEGAVRIAQKRQSIDDFLILLALYSLRL